MVWRQKYLVISLVSLVFLIMVLRVGDSFPSQNISMLLC